MVHFRVVHFHDYSLSEFVNVSDIYELDITDSAIFTQNMEKVFRSFVQFLNKVESEGRKNSQQIKEWIQNRDQGGNSTISRLLNWANWLDIFQEEFLSFLSKVNFIWTAFLSRQFG